MTYQEKIAAAQEKINQEFSFTTVVVKDWKGQRVYLSRPNESKAYQEVGYVRVSDGQCFPAFGTKARTERDRDAQKMLDAVASIIIEKQPEEEKPFVSMFL